MSLEDKAVTPVHLGPIELEVFSGALARQVVPSVCEQHSAHVYEQRRDGVWLLHLLRPAQRYFVKSE